LAVSRFFEQTIHVAHISRTIFGIAGVFVTGSTPGEKRTFGRVRAWNGAVSDAIAVGIEITAILRQSFQVPASYTLPKSYFRLSSQVRGGGKVFVHAQIEVDHHDDGRLQAIGQIEGQGLQFETLFGICRENRDVLGISM